MTTEIPEEQKTCRERSPCGLFICTLVRGHDGEHVAEGVDIEVCERWEAEIRSTSHEKEGNGT